MRPVRILRSAAAVLLLSTLTYLGVRMVPLYWRNVEFQRDLEGLLQDPAMGQLSPAAAAVAVADRAARMGLPVRSGDVRVTRGASGLRVAVRYAVPVDLGVYTVDLHFRAAAGAR